MRELLNTLASGVKAELGKIYKSETLRARLSFFNHSHFWIWNVLFCGLSVFGIMPNFLGECTISALTGEMPLGIYGGILGLWLIPIASVLLGIKYHQNGRLLFRYFYGVEIPLMLLFFFRAFVLKENLWTADLFLGMCAVTIAYLGFTLVTEKKQAGQRRKKWEFVPQGILLWMSLTLGLVGLLFVIPMCWSMLQSIIWVLLSEDLFEMLAAMVYLGIFGSIFAFFAAFTVVVVVIAPVAFLMMTLRTWWEWAAKSKRVRVGWSVTTAVVLSVGLFSASQLNRPPEIQKIAELAESGKFADASDEELTKLKAQLTDAYLHRYRYPLHQEVRVFENWFRGVSGNEAHWISRPWTQVYCYLLSPFVYYGDPDDGVHAEQAYQSLFDTAIQKAERVKIKHAMEAHYERTETEAGLLELEDRSVSVTAQSLQVEDHGSWAQVELFETYENNTFQQQESFYYFSLPPEAAINGLYLGNTPDKSKAFKYRVSPRGAAQEVYKAQKRRRVDPALLEQVGPRQYRLRVFPIPRKQRDFGSADVHADKLYLWMEFQVIKDGATIPMPTLLEKRNTEFADSIQRRCNRKTSGWLCDRWLPSIIQGTPNKETITKLTLEDQIFTKQAVEQGFSGRICVIIDGSYSMRAHAEAWAKTMAELPNTSKLYLASPNATTLHEISDLSEARFYGTLECSQILNQFLATTFSQQFEVVLLLTDEGGYEVSSDAQLNRAWTPQDGALHVLHLGGKLAPAYTDSVQDAITASQGGIGTKLAELPAFNPYRWSLEESPTPVNTPHQPAAIAAKLLIERKSAEGNVSPEELSVLHELAQRHHIVTSYSSMIVLVNQAQHRQLDQAEKRADKFEREADTGVEEIRANQPSSVFGIDNGSIPEPSTSLLLLISFFSTLCVRNRK